MLGAGLGGYGGYDSPEGLADAHGMGYGDVDGGAWGGGNYSALARAAMDAWSKYYGGNSSLLGHNRSVFGGPMLTSGPTDVQGAMIGSNIPNNNTIDAIAMNNQGPRLGNRTTPMSGPWQTITNVSQPDPVTSIANNQNYSYYGHGGPLEHNLHSLGIGPNYNGIGISFPGGHPGSVGPMGPAEGGGEYIRRKLRSLAYDNAYNQWEGGDNPF